MPYPYYSQVPTTPYESYNTMLRYPPNPYPEFSPEGNFGQIKAKFINSIDEVSAQEVPMNGVGAIFLTRNRRYVYTKNWSPDGTIKTQRYILDDSVDEPEEEPDFAHISEELASVKERLAKLEQTSEKRTVRRSSKEVTSDDA